MKRLTNAQLQTALAGAMNNSQLLASDNQHLARQAAETKAALEIAKGVIEMERREREKAFSEYSSPAGSVVPLPPTSEDSLWERAVCCIGGLIATAVAFGILGIPVQIVIGGFLLIGGLAAIIVGMSP